MSRIIVTDLTRFSNTEILCTAGIDTDTGQVIRPMPYLKAATCAKLEILPGAILSGNFTSPDNLDSPHIEDMNYQNLTFNGPCSIEEFRAILADTSEDSIEAGFEVKLDDRQKHIPRNLAPMKSLITVRVNPHQVQIVQDGYDKTKIKAHLTDASGKDYSFLSISDLGFHSYAANHYQEAGDYAEMNALIHSQNEVYLRIGLSRFYEVGGRAGFWIQVNGIYTFPNYFEIARQYE